MTREEISDTSSRIRKKIEAGGASLNPPLPLNDVTTWEAKWGVALPEEYRQFILKIGNGGEGPPCYGLMGLGTVPNDLGRSASDDLKHISKPFPFKDVWIREDEKNTDEAKREQVNHGRLILGSEGCGRYWALIVTGPCRGEIWDFTDVGIQPCSPRIHLLQWYESWLDGETNGWKAAR